MMKSSKSNEYQFSQYCWVRISKIASRVAAPLKNFKKSLFLKRSIPFHKKQFQIVVKTCSTSQSMAEKPNVVFVLGAPGAGKGTQCQKIKEKFGYEHLSAGDLLRAEMKTDSKDSALISSFIKDGKIVPVEITCSLLLKAMKNSPKSHFVIDGFPRNENNLLGWNKTVKDDVNLKFVLFFECDTQVGVERCMKRGKSSGRSDDNEESLKKRIITYTEETMPIILHYEKMNKVNRVKAEKGPDEVFGEVSKLLEG